MLAPIHFTFLTKKHKSGCPSTDNVIGTMVLSQGSLGMTSLRFAQNSSSIGKLFLPSMERFFKRTDRSPDPSFSSGSFRLWGKLDIHKVEVWGKRQGKPW